MFTTVVSGRPTFGPDKVTLKVSVGSLTMSPQIVTNTGLVVSPGAKVTVWSVIEM